MAATADKISEEQKKAISKNWTYIQGNLDAKDILPYLIQGGFMQPSDRETIISYNPNTTRNRNCAFFSWLFDSPRGAYDAFMSALRINRGWVEEKIRNTDVDENDVIIDPMRQFDGAVKDVIIDPMRQFDGAVKDAIIDTIREVDAIANVGQTKASVKSKSVITTS